MGIKRLCSGKLLIFLISLVFCGGCVQKLEIQKSIWSSYTVTITKSDTSYVLWSDSVQIGKIDGLSIFRIPILRSGSVITLDTNGHHVSETKLQDIRQDALFIFRTGDTHARYFDSSNDQFPKLLPIDSLLENYTVPFVFSDSTDVEVNVTSEESKYRQVFIPADSNRGKPAYPDTTYLYFEKIDEGYVYPFTHASNTYNGIKITKALLVNTKKISKENDSQSFSRKEQLFKLRIANKKENQELSELFLKAKK